MDGATPVQAAEREAWEEAGVKGKSKPVCLGIYSYYKGIDKKTLLPCVVAVFPVKVRTIANDWPERKERKRRWVSLKKASKLVSEPELAALLLHLDPERL